MEWKSPVVTCAIFGSEYFYFSPKSCFSQNWSFSSHLSSLGRINWPNHGRKSDRFSQVFWFFWDVQEKFSPKCAKWYRDPFQNIILQLFELNQAEKDVFSHQKCISWDHLCWSLCVCVCCKSDCDYKMSYALGSVVLLVVYGCGADRFSFHLSVMGHSTRDHVPVR